MSAAGAEDVGACAHADDVLLVVEDGEMLDFLVDDAFERGQEHVVGRDCHDIGTRDARQGCIGGGVGCEEVGSGDDADTVAIFVDERVGTV